MSEPFSKMKVKRTVYHAQATTDYIFAPVLACDLDKTIRYNAEDPDDYIDGPETVAVYEGVEEKLWDYYRDGYIIAGITNQGGVAFNFKTPEQVDAEIQAMVEQFDRNPFVHIHSCMQHPDGDVSPFSNRSMMRKPQVGMLAILEDHLWDRGYIPNWDESIVVGDMESDKKLAENAGMKFRYASDFFERDQTQQSN